MNDQRLSFGALLGLTVLALGSLAACALAQPKATLADKKTDAGIKIDKEKRRITIPARVAPRKINDPAYKEIYPIEVIATFPFPRGKKAHETVVTIEATPSAVHKALEEFGLKAGKPALTAEDKQTGPEVKIMLDLKPGKSGSQLIPIEQFLVDKKSGKPMPRVKWLFTGSVMTANDPNKPKEYGADLKGTLITVFPVTGETVFQSSLSLKDEKYVKLETSKRLPAIGTAVQLVIEVPKAK